MLGMNFGRDRLKKTTQQMNFFHRGGRSRARISRLVMAAVIQRQSPVWTSVESDRFDGLSAFTPGPPATLCEAELGHHGKANHIRLSRTHHNT